MEEWKDIIDYEGLYQISNYGRVKSLGNDKTKKEKILKFGKDKDGYLQVHLCKNGKKKTCKVHRLVAQAFIPNPNNYEEINHKNENREMNTVENLEWCTRQYNVEYSQSKQVNQYSLNGKLIATFKSINEVQRELGFNISCISLCCNGKINTAYKYKWKHV